MAFRVEVAPRAFDDLDEIAGYIRRNGSFRQAEDWFNGIIDAIQTLEVMPSRCPIANESEDVGQQVRVLLYGKRNRRYKVYYAIQGRGRTAGTVRVFHVRHRARKALTAGDLRELMDEAPDEA
jgi:plasmid stabilization system protein ParE